MVDWRPEDRGDLEVAMKTGIVVLHYDCSGFRVLADCAVDGTYGFVGMTTKQQLLRLNNADEVEANLPLNGVKLAASVSADFQRGASLDIGMLMIGKMMTTRAEVRRDQLRGQCQDATHFLRGATLGAFVMQTGTNADIGSVMNLFGSSAAVASSSRKSVRNQDGTPDACSSATPDASTAPAQCGALLRGQLSPIGPAATGPEDADAAGCPVGLRRVAGKCTAGEPEGAHDCDISDAADCEQQCTRGNATSCSRAGWAYMHGWKVLRDEKRGADWLTRGCDGGSADGCSALGAAFLGGTGVTKDAARAHDLFARACDGASARGCQNLGTASYDGIGTSKDRSQALAVWRRACNAGNAAGCYGVGLCLEAGDCGAAPDRAAANAAYKRACQGGYAAACGGRSP